MLWHGSALGVLQCSGGSGCLAMRPLNACKEADALTGGPAPYIYIICHQLEERLVPAVTAAHAALGQGWLAKASSCLL